MVYEMRMYHVKYMRMDDMVERHKQWLPLFEEHGATLIGFWTTDIGIRPTLVYILAFKDLGAREKFWDDVLADKRWTDELGPDAKRDPLVEQQYISILRPVEFSPLK